MKKARPNEPGDLLTPRASPQPSPPLGGDGEEAALPPALVEYRTLARERWRVELFAELAAELALTAPWADAARAVHDAASPHARPWLIVRRLFGVAPLIGEPEDFRVCSREELCAEMGLSAKQLQAELDAVRVLLKPAPSPQPSPPVRGEGAPRKELDFGDDALREFGFDEKMFKVTWYDEATKTQVPRDAESNKLERDWFAARVSEWARYLRVPNAAVTARYALMNMLYLRRLEGDMTVMRPGTPEFRRLSEDKAGLEKTYAVQLKQLQEMFPELGGTAGSISFRASIEDWVRGWWEYKANGDNRLLDRCHTAAEIEQQMRQSVQTPEPAYRFGQNTATIEAQKGLYDPEWKPSLRESDLKKLDAGFKAGVEALRQATGAALVDLEKEGPEGEYPELHEVEKGKAVSL